MAEFILVIHVVGAVFVIVEALILILNVAFDGAAIYTNDEIFFLEG